MSRHRPGQAERVRMDQDRAALAKAVIDGRADEARRLAQAELARQAQREADRKRRQGER